MKNILLPVLLLFPFFAPAESLLSIRIDGKDGNTIQVNGEKYTRICFKDDSFILASQDSSNDDIELFYSVFNRISFPEYSSIFELPSDNDYSIKVVGGNLSILGPENDTFHVRVFDSKGILHLEKTIEAQQNVALNNLNSGMYIALATNDTTHVSIKFIVK